MQKIQITKRDKEKIMKDYLKCKGCDCLLDRVPVFESKMVFGRRIDFFCGSREALYKQSKEQEGYCEECGERKKGL